MVYTDWGMENGDPIAKSLKEVDMNSRVIAHCRINRIGYDDKA